MHHPTEKRTTEQYPTEQYHTDQYRAKDQSRTKDQYSDQQRTKDQQRANDQQRATEKLRAKDKQRAIEEQRAIDEQCATDKQLAIEEQSAIEKKSNEHRPLTVKLQLSKAPLDQSLPEDQMKRCEAIVKELKKPKYQAISWPFQQPVDADAWGATDYYEIIKQPMDMSTYERKLNNGEYKDEEELAQDIRLMFRNCYAYNPPDHEINSYGHQLEQVFEKYWEKLHQGKKKSSKKRRTSQKGELKWYEGYSVLKNIY